MSEPTSLRRIREFWKSDADLAAVADAATIAGAGDLPSIFAVTDLAVASVGAAGLAMAALIEAQTGALPAVMIDRRLASFWFSSSLKPQGWEPPPLWDAIAGDYKTRDGWIRLHTNAPHHRAAAQSVIGAHETRDAVAAAVAIWDKTALESAIVEAGGCAAEMRTMAEWRAHPAGIAVAQDALAITPAHSAGIGPKGWDWRPGRPLAGLRVLDLTRVLAGPVATRFLAGYGADVLRLDPPHWNEPGVIPEMTPGKRCARLDLKTPEGRATFTRLVADADVLVNGYRSDALGGMGFSDAELQAIRPGLIIVRLDAYGWQGPWRKRRGFDSLVQMSSGIAAAGMAWKKAEKPFPLPVQALDHAAGYLLAAEALRHLATRASTGEGRISHLSLARTAKVLTDWGQREPGAAFAPQSDGDIAPALENTHWGPALRLRPPLAIEGAAMVWDRPASDLGTAEPRWL